MKTFFSRGLLLALVVVLLGSAQMVLAQTATPPPTGGLNTTAVQGLSDSIIGLLNTVVVPLVFALAFIVFLWGVFQAFILGANNEEKRKEGAQFVLWALIGFVVMISIWGLVNLTKSLFPTSNNVRPDLPCFDKDPAKCNR
jgi:hypothetical protein